MTDWVKRPNLLTPTNEPMVYRRNLVLEKTWEAIEQLQGKVDAANAQATGHIRYTPNAKEPTAPSAQLSKATIDLVAARLEICDLERDKADLERQNTKLRALLTEGRQAVQAWPEPDTWAKWGHYEQGPCPAFAKGRRIAGWLAAVAEIGAAPKV